MEVKKEVEVPKNKFEDKILSRLRNNVNYGKDDICYLRDRITKNPLPLTNVELKVDVMQSVASLEMTQFYSNYSSQPVESVFFFPKDIEAVITKLTCEFTLSDGTKKVL